MREQPRLAIFGAGGLGREVLALAQGLSWRVPMFLVDPGHPGAEFVHGVPVHRDAIPRLRADPGCAVIVAIGNPADRARATARLEAAIGPRFATLVHPAATIGPHVSLAPGCMVLGPASATADIRIGRHVLVNPGCTLAHDVVIEDFVSLGPGVALAGGARVETGADLGIGARIGPRITVGAGALVGAGAVVLANVLPGGRVAGVPARPI
jgi:sugar O-acyltransferase (sialic acid O-acetyltransferase NeuD family)